MTNAERARKRRSNQVADIALIAVCAGFLAIAWLIGYAGCAVHTVKTARVSIHGEFAVFKINYLGADIEHITLLEGM